MEEDPYKNASSQIDTFRSEVINSHRALERKFIDTKEALRELPEDGINVSKQSKLNLVEILSKAIAALQTISDFLKDRQNEFQKLQCDALKNVIREQRGRKQQQQSDSGYGSTAYSLINRNRSSQPLQLIQSRPRQHCSGKNKMPIQHKSLDDDIERAGQLHDDSTYIDGLVFKCNVEDSESEEESIEKMERWKKNCLSPNASNIHSNMVDIGVQTTFSAKKFATHTRGFDDADDENVTYSSTGQDFTSLQHKCDSKDEGDVNINAQETIAEQASHNQKIIFHNENRTHQNLERILKGAHANYDDNIKDNTNSSICKGNFSEQDPSRSLITTREGKYEVCTQGVIVPEVLDEEHGNCGVLT